MLQDLQSGFTHYHHFFGHCGTLWGQNGNFSRLRFNNSPLVKTKNLYSIALLLMIGV